MATLSDQIKKQLKALLEDEEAAGAVAKVFDTVAQIVAMGGSKDVDEMLENAIKDGAKRKKVAQVVYLWAQRIVGEVSTEDLLDDARLANLISKKHVAYVKSVFGNWREVYALGGEDVVVAALSLIANADERKSVAKKLYMFATAKYAKPVSTSGQDGGVNITGNTHVNGDITGRDKIVNV